MLPFTEPVLSRRYCNTDTTVLQYRHDGTPVPNAGYRNRYWNVFCHLA